MSDHDRDSWARRWAQALRTHGDRVAQRPPNARLTAELADLRPGRALDAGCGHGSDALWPAARGWHVTAGSVEALARRMASGVAPGGTLFLVGHRPIDPVTGAETAAAGQVQVSVEAALAALQPGGWQPIVEERPRATAGSGVDAVIRARRASGG